MSILNDINSQQYKRGVKSGVTLWGEEDLNPSAYISRFLSKCLEIPLVAEPFPVKDPAQTQNKTIASSDKCGQFSSGKPSIFIWLEKWNI